MNYDNADRCGNQSPSPESRTKSQIEADAARRPAIRVNLDAVPAALRERPQWVLWRYRWSAKRGKWTKEPLYIAEQTGAGARRRLRFGMASSTDPATWHTFEQVARLVGWYQRLGRPLPVGIGFVFAPTDPFTGIDLDDCRDPITGELTAAAARWLAALDSYSEVSPSLTGVKVIVGGTPPGDECRADELGVEHYHRGRFFTITGDVLPNHPAAPQPRQQQLDAFYAEVHPEDTPERRETRQRETAEAAAARAATLAARPDLSLSDQQVIERASAAKNGAAFSRLWSGDWSTGYESRSDADAALAGMLAFWCGPDPDRVEALMERSGLVRAKWWEGRRGGTTTYLRMTVEHVVAGARHYYGDGSFHGHTFPTLIDDAAELARVVGLLVGGSRERAAEREENRIKALFASIVALASPLPPELVEEKRREDAAIAAAKAIAAADALMRANSDASVCTCGLTQFQHDPEAGTVHLVNLFGKTSSSDKCKCCARRYRAEWRAHLANTIMASPNEVFFVGDVLADPKSHKAFLDCMGDLDAEWATISSTPAIDLAVATASFEGAREVTKAEAIRFIDQAVANLPSSSLRPGRMIRTCREWQIRRGKRDRARKVIKTFDKTLTWGSLAGAFGHFFDMVDFGFPNGGAIQRSADSKLTCLSAKARGRWDPEMSRQETRQALLGIACDMESIARGADPDVCISGEWIELAPRNDRGNESRDEFDLDALTDGTRAAAPTG